MNWAFFPAQACILTTENKKMETQLQISASAESHRITKIPSDIYHTSSTSILKRIMSHY